MQRALAEHPQVRLRQLVYSGWTQQRAYEQAKQLVSRYPQVSLVWSANDEMALGAMQAFQEQQRQPGKDRRHKGLGRRHALLRPRLQGQRMRRGLRQRTFPEHRIGGQR